MLNFLKSLFRGSGRQNPKESAAIEYNGYRIMPAPQPGDNGWTTEAIITRVTDGEQKSHHFIRADTSADLDGAIELTISKSKAAIDQTGERIFG